VVTTSTPQPLTTAEDDGFPWLAVGGGAAALVVVSAAGAGVLYYVETQAPVVHTVNDPDHAKLSVTVAP
jgi:hypothetical protein